MTTHRLFIGAATLAMVACGDAGPGPTPPPPPPPPPVPSYTLSVSPANLTVAQGTTGQATVTIARTGGFVGSVTLTVEGAPVGLAAAFAPSATTASSSVLTLSAAPALPKGNYTLTVKGITTELTDRTFQLPAIVPALAGGSSVTGGADHTCGRTAGNVASCSGNNPAGQIGDGTLVDRLIPTPVSGGIPFVELAASNGDHTCGRTAAGTVYCWGRNLDGELGDGTTVNRSTPVAVSGNLNFVAVTTGRRHSCGRTAENATYCWGGNTWGQVGDGTVIGRTTPTLVSGNLSFVELGMGAGFTCGRTAGGAVYCWGYNEFGAVGDGTFIVSRPTPTPVTGGLTFIELSANGACGQTIQHATYCWGFNANGQVGDGTVNSRSTPTLVQGGLTFVEVEANGPHSCGRVNSGAVYCWGLNDNGQVGDGTLIDRYTPVPVRGGLTFAALMMGGYHSCGRTTSNAVYCWGRNADGQLGDGTKVNRNEPIAVPWP